MDLAETLDLLDYRRRVADLYADVRARGASRETWSAWRERRDALFREHPSSPYPEGRRPGELAYFPYDPAFRVLGRAEPASEQLLEIAHSADGTTTARRVATVGFELGGRHHALELFWLDQYGGGVFLPFRDATSGDTTYGGGRYLLDTAKGADLGSDDGALVLDFNFAYHPSCFHDPRWSCPLAPPGSVLSTAVTAGERARATA
jgi:uncharacterized protein (DUF1684 family)